MPAARTIAYASTSPSPKVSQTDTTLSVADLPVVAGIKLYGAATDTGDVGATFTYAWAVVSAPAGYTGTFDDATLAEPTFAPIDAHWENYRFQLIAVSSGPGGSSAGATPDEEPYEIFGPDSAFVDVRIESVALGLQRNADRDRNYGPQIRKYATKIEQVKTDLGNQTIGQHADVSTATGPLVDRLCDGSYATTAPSGAGSALHLHRGSAVDPATKFTRGAVVLEDVASSPSNPVVSNVKERLYSASSNGTATDAGWVNGIAVPQGGGPLALWEMASLGGNQKPRRLSIVMADGGSAVDQYRFRLKAGSFASWVAGTPTLIATVVSTLPVTQGDPIVLIISAGDFTGISWPAGTYVGLVCDLAPPGTLTSPLGGRLTATLQTTEVL